MTDFDSFNTPSPARVAEENSEVEVQNFPISIDERLNALDQKVIWMCSTLQWMAGIFNGLQAAASMMPGKAGKLAAQVMNGGNSNG